MGAGDINRCLNAPVGPGDMDCLMPLCAEIAHSSHVVSVSDGLSSSLLSSLAISIRGLPSGEPSGPVSQLNFAILIKS